jgi:hypothetical protein
VCFFLEIPISLYSNIIWRRHKDLLKTSICWVFLIFFGEYLDEAIMQILPKDWRVGYLKICFFNLRFLGFSLFSISNLSFIVFISTYFLIFNFFCIYFSMLNLLYGLDFILKSSIFLGKNICFIVLEFLT